jgi:hypothetical protein
MKFVIMTFGILFSSAMLASSFIEIQPGSSINVEAGEDVRVTCVGTSGHGGQVSGDVVKVASCIRTCGNTTYFSNVVLQIKKVFPSGKEVSSCNEMTSESACNDFALQINVGN